MIDLSSPAFQRDPFPTFRRLRDEAPFYRDPVSGWWFVSRHADIQTILRDPSTFSSEIASFETTLHGADGPTHETHRRAVAEHARQWHRRWSRMIADETSQLLDKADGKPFDLVEDYAVAVSMTVLRQILGFAETDDGLLRSCSRQMLFSDARAQLRDAISAIIERDDGRAGSLASDLREAGGIGPHAILEICMLLVVAAVQTTKNLIGSAMLKLVTRAELRRAVVGDEKACFGFMEEVLRFDAPVQRAGRLTRRRFETSEVTIPEGSSVLLLIGSGNRDASVFVQGDVFDPARNPNPHLAFGGASHFCLGAQLARTTAFHAIQTLFKRFPDTTLAEPGTAVPMETHLALWGPTRLMVHLA